MIRKLFNLVKSGNHNWQFWINTGWLIFDKIFHMALSLVVTAMVTRYLGVEQYGLLSYGLAFIDIFTIICKLGIDGIIVNELIKNRDRTGEILGSTTFLRLLSSFLSMILIKSLSLE